MNKYTANNWQTVPQRKEARGYWSSENLPKQANKKANFSVSNQFRVLYVEDEAAGDDKKEVKPPAPVFIQEVNNYLLFKTDVRIKTKFQL